MTNSRRPGLRYRLVLDIQATQSAAHGERGIARYVREQTRALLHREVVEAVVLNPNLPFPRRLDQDLLASPRLRWNTLTQLRRVAEAAPGPLAYYLMSPFELSLWPEGDVPPHVVRGDVPVVMTVYDVIPLLMADRYLADRSLARRYRARAELLHQADAVLTISEHTRADVVDHLGLSPGKVVSIGAGVSPFFRPATPADDPAGLLARHVRDLDRPFVLNVSGGDPRKNTERLLEAWAAVPERLRDDVQLVVSCSIDPPVRAAWESHAKEVGLRDGDLVLTGWVPDEVLRALYQAARLFVFPPLYEGFGLPAAEAIACGCPAITSSTSSLPEVLEWPEAAFDPEDVDAMAAVIERGLTDAAFRSALVDRATARAPLFTWDAVADRTVAALGRLLPAPAEAAGSTAAAASTGATRTELPVRLALVGPMPPTLSGIADYNARLVPALAARSELDVYSPSPAPDTPPAPGVRWFPTLALGRTSSPWAYDAVIYTVGNSDDHHDLYELAQEFPGLLWLHDVRLPGLYITYARDRVPDERGSDFLTERLLRQYRRRKPLHLPTDPTADETQPPLYGEWGLGLTKELVDVARGAIVSSELAARLLALDQQPDTAPTSTWVVPLAAPTPTSAPLADSLGRRVDRAPASAPILACFGLVAPVKGAETVIAMLPALRRRFPAATVALVGPVGDGYRDHLGQLAERAGVADAVTITGVVEDEAYRDWMARATCAVQLRLATNGESSAAVVDALAAGVPVVTNVAAAAELPTGTVSLLPLDVDARHVADHLADLLDRPDELDRLADAGRSWAESWGFDQVADRLLDIVRHLP